MDTTSRSTTEERGRRIQSLLALGLLLGIVAIVTLATWNTDDYAGAVITTSDFNLEGSTTGTIWGNHSLANPAALDFGLAAENLAPREVVDAPFALRLSAGTSTDAVVTVSAANAATALTDVSYTLFSTSEFGCASGLQSVIVPAGTPLNSSAGSVPFDMAAGPDGKAGPAVNLCFRITAGPNIESQQSGAAVWRFSATSKAS